MANANYTKYKYNNVMVINHINHAVNVIYIATGIIKLEL